MLKLYIGNKNYSSWSMRPWVLLKQAGIPFEEVMLRFDSFDPDSEFKTRINAVSPTAKVPLLTDGPLAVWDSLAITEYLAEYAPNTVVWPADRAARAQARSVCAEMHGGFTSLRKHCAMNIEAHLPEIGTLVWRDQAGVRADVARLVAMWQGLLARHGGPLLFGEFCAADAYFAPVCTRIVTYALPVPDDIAAYVQRVLALPGVQAWTADALTEHDFVVFDEPYRVQAGPHAP